MGCLNQHIEANGICSEPKGGTLKPPRSALACMVNSEIGAVLAVMRRNVRWGIHYAASDDQLEHSLIQSFKELRKKIFSWQHQWNTIDPLVYLQPFLDVVQSDETGAPITGVALSSIYKFLSLEILDSTTKNVDKALHRIVDAVTSCRFEVTDSASEEVVLMKILQVLLACMKSKASIYLGNQHVCNIVNTCFRLVRQASAKSELLQRITRHTMHELVRCIFSRLPDIESKEDDLVQRIRLCATPEVGMMMEGQTSGDGQSDGGSVNAASNHKAPSGEGSVNLDPSNVSPNTLAIKKDEKAGQKESVSGGELSMMDPYGIPCMVEILHFLCSLLNVMDHMEIGPRSNPIAYDEDVPLFALGLINSAIELGGASFGSHPKLMALIQEELFRTLMRFGLSMSPLILSTVSSIVLNLYHHLRAKLKLQLETFFSGVLLRIAQNKHGASYQQQEVALEALVDLCRQHVFMTEMYANFDCDISCGNIFEELANLLSKSTFPVNSPLSAMNTIALDGLIAMVDGICERIGHGGSVSEFVSLNSEEYKPFWTEVCRDYNDPIHWVPFVHKMKQIKQKLMIGADHFNRDPKKGLEFVQGMHLLPGKLDPISVACFIRYAPGLDKNLIGDFLGSHDEFCIDVLQEFARTFDFRDINLDIALRIFLETFRLPGESQKIQRVLEAFAERYYEQSPPDILANKDAALLLSYSLIMLNTDQHNAQVKKKMTEEDFIRNNRRINGGKDLPRELLSELYRSISENEIRMTPDAGTGASAMMPSYWIGLVHRSKHTAPFVVCDARPYLDRHLFAVLSGPTIAAISVVFDHVEQEGILQTCVNGFLTVAKISASYNFDQVLDDLVVSLCKFTNLLLPSYSEDFIMRYCDDAKARMATTAVFTIANKYGDHIHSGWKNILDCILSLHKLGLLPSRILSDATDDPEPSADVEKRRSAAAFPLGPRVPLLASNRKSSGLMGRFSQFLYLDIEEPAAEPSEEQIDARRRTLQMIQNCHVDNIFADSKFLQAESLLQLVQALILAAGRHSKGKEDEGTAVFCLELLIAITLNNRDRIMLLWQGVYEHIASIVQSTVMPCALVEKAVFGLLQICQRLLPYKENLTDELLMSLQLVLKLDARVADAYLQQITEEVMHLVKANATQIRSHTGWRTIISLLSITARHPEASGAGYETLSFIMSGGGAHLLPANYVLCVNAARQFAEYRVGDIEQCVKSLDLMAGSVVCLVRWFHKTKEALVEEAASKMCQDIWEMWLRLVQGLRKVCLDSREVVRNHAILALQRCLTEADGIHIPNDLWSLCFNQLIFTLTDDLLELAHQNSTKDHSIEEAIVLSLKLMSKVFLQRLQDLSQLASFQALWVTVLDCSERCMKVKLRGKRSGKIPELVPELLKNILLVMKTTGILSPEVGNFWQLTWSHVKNIAPSLQSEIFSPTELEQLQKQNVQPDGSVLVASSKTTA